ncbi:solute carrier family 35, member F1/2 [Marchantia polymorpha subsp. ruderalis]|uniref:EamA domain-containing protein n=2 Tax=Marchantia polymorpha TaxID=3197 RepID=A0A176WM22_MARPO|nr:hypothetical protein AXG93_1593s1570 [Marchantia polymorpha subsp. ruderalis]PTQ29069.1 hypothetical protein MARPO_0148s0019 [Marchantia polymorpha]BBN09085.1 hypothetical protein Mp_4g17010 [Marchantia polymorpha subsp. ruderalis]|eukprot:PTQ29069.1 hypothetical protein MARPO_0148s0019 [Marchantia polymorpha]
MVSQTVKAVALGQVLSLLVTGTSFSSSQLARYGINAPMTQVFFNYLLMSGVYGSYLLYLRKPLKFRWYLYLLFAVIDVQANYLATMAYQYTSITSAMLLDCWTVPLVLALTWLFLKTQYLRGHFVGVCICVLGLVLVVFSDVHADDRASGGSRPILGDILMLLGATGYAISNVYEEFLVKKVDRLELLAMMGGFGAITSFVQVVLIEREVLLSTQWTVNAVLPFISYSVCLFSFCTLVPALLQISGATMFNLSMLTSDMYAVAIRWLIYQESVDWLYFVAFATVAVGLAWYTRSGDAPAIALEIEKGYEKLESDPPVDMNLPESVAP